jgi:hypothetical protein
MTLELATWSGALRRAEASAFVESALVPLRAYVATWAKAQLTAGGKPAAEHVLVLRVQEERRHEPLLPKVFLHILISFYNFFLWTLEPFFNFILLLLFYLSLSGILFIPFFHFIPSTVPTCTCRRGTTGAHVVAVGWLMPATASLETRGVAGRCSASLRDHCRGPAIAFGCSHLTSSQSVVMVVKPKVKGENLFKSYLANKLNYPNLHKDKNSKYNIY